MQPGAPSSVGFDLAAGAPERTQLSESQASAAQKRRLGRVRIEGVRCDRGEPLDMSMQGLRIRSRRAWPVGEVRAVTLRTSRLRITLPGTCVWAQKEGMFRHLLGVSFEHASPEQQAVIAELAHTHTMRVQSRRAA